MNRSVRDGPSSGAWGLLAAIVAMALIGALSAVPWTPATAGKAMLRLSWRAAGVVVEKCRAPTEEENARLPAHMRLPEICDGRSPPFLLEASVDGAVVLHDTIAAAGVSGDRPLYVLDLLEVTPGEHDVTVTFDVIPTGPAPTTSGFPLHLRLATRVAVAPGQTVLITYDPATRSLVTRP